MRARYWAVAACALGPLGCGLISGLDQLKVGDASASLDGGDAASVSDAPSDAAVISVNDAGEGGPPPVEAGQASIHCGNLACTGGQVCCLSLQGSQFMCAAQCGPGARPLRCDDPTDCTGTNPVCCGTLSDAGELMSSACGALCNGIQLCDPNTITVCKCSGVKVFGTETLGYCQ